MSKIQTISTNYTAGEQSPRLRARVDLEKYNASAKELFNVVLLRQGGVTIRPPTKYIGEVKDSADFARIIPFIKSRTDAYLLEFGDLYFRIWKNGAVIGGPYEVTTPYAHTVLDDLEFAQGADTMLMVLGSVAPQSVKRFADDRWTMAQTTFNPAPQAEMGDRNAGTMSIDNVALGAGRTLTAGAAFFLASDVGRRMTWGGGVALITAVGSTTSATATVEVAFGSSSANGSGGADPVWVLEGSPQTTCTPSAATPVGGACTLTLSAAGWRADVVGGVVEINDGLVRVDAYSSTTVVTGVILKALTGTTGAPADAWVQKKSMFNATDGYPNSVNFHQQRTWLANTARFPQIEIGSKTGLYFDFTPGVDDDAAVYKTLDSNDPVDFLVSSGKALLALTMSAEFETKGGIEKPITQTNAQLNRGTRWGCAKVRPEQVGNDYLFMQRGGKVMRAIRQTVDAFSATDISVFSEHLLRLGVKFMTFQQTPESVLWVGTTDGKLLAVTYNEEQNTIAFTSGEVSGGVVEWGITVPEGDEDATYLLVKRTINGVVKRYIEKLDWGNWTTDQEIRNAHDCRKEVTGASATVWSGFDHLEGETVSVLADGIYHGEFVVTSGDITLTRAATTVSAGRPYIARAKQEAPEVAMGTGTSQGQAISVHSTQVRFFKTIGCWINGKKVPFRNFDTAETLDSAPAPFSGLKEASSLGWSNGEAELTLEQRLPYPWTVLGVIRDVTINSG